MTDSEILKLIHSDMQEVKSDVRVLKVEIKEEMQNLKEDMAEVKSDVQNLKEDMLEVKDNIRNLQEDVQRLNKEVDGIKDNMERVEEKVQGLQITYENELNRKISIIAEGHIDLSRKLDDALRIETEKEMLSLRVITLENDVRKLREAKKMHKLI